SRAPRRPATSRPAPPAGTGRGACQAENQPPFGNPGASLREIPGSAARCPRSAGHDRNMTNQHGKPDADPAGNQPTQQFWAGPDAPTATPTWGQPGPAGLPGPAGPGFTGNPAPSPKAGHRKALHWTAGLLAAALLAGGGTIAATRLASHS